MAPRTQYVVKEHVRTAAVGFLVLAVSGALAALLTAFSAAAVARILPHLPKHPRSWIVTGGGARNPVMMRFLAENLAPASVETGESAGWSSDHVEAQAFAFLAVRSLNGLPLSFPKTTGVPAPQTGGVIARP